MSRVPTWREMYPDAVIARCPFCRWFRMPADKLGKAIYAVHLREEHQRG